MVFQTHTKIFLLCSFQCTRIIIDNSHHNNDIFFVNFLLKHLCSWTQYSWLFFPRELKLLPDITVEFTAFKRIDWLKIIVINRNHKQWLSTIPPVSTKWTITAQILPLNTKKITTCDVSNPDPSLGQTHKCGRV